MRFVYLVFMVILLMEGNVSYVSVMGMCCCVILIWVSVFVLLRVLRGMSVSCEYYIFWIIRED